MGFFDHVIVKSLPLVPKPIVARLSRPYIAGATLSNAVACVQSLNDQGFCATVDLLGEFVTEFGQVDASYQGYVETLQAIKEHDLKTGISVKPTFFGLLLDEARCLGYLENLLEEVVRTDRFMRIDMEDSKCTDATIRLYDVLRKKHPNHVGIVLQSYMRRSLGDVASICASDQADFRLCKGIYVEPEEVAFKRPQEVRDNFVATLDAMLDAGARVGIATHDDALIQSAEDRIRARALTSDQYEFQMLLGVRENVRDRLRDAGHKVRIYVPYGKDWYGYSTRRLKENPALAGTFFKAMFWNR